MGISVTSAPIGRAASRHRVMVGAGAALAVSLVLAVGLSRETVPPAPLVAGAGLAVLSIAWLAFVRYEAAIALGLLLLAVVRFQPAPTDAVFAFVIAVAALSGRLHLSRVPSVMLVLLAALLALNVLSAVDSVSAGTAITFFGITFYLALFAVWLAGYVDTRRHAKQVVVWYLAAALISATLAVLAISAPIPGRSVLLFDTARAQALFKDPNVFGPFLIPALLILLEETLRPCLLPAPRRAKIAGIIVLALGLLFSYSRGAWVNIGVGLLVMLAVLLLRPRSARIAARMLVVVLLAVVSGVAAIAITGSGSLLQERAALQGYDASRFSAQEAGIQLGEHHPLGVGPGQVDVILPLATHNSYVRVFAEQGPLGLLLLAALWLGTLGLAARNAFRGRDTYGIGSAALLAAWCGMLVNSAVIDTLHWRHLWLVAALIWAGAARGAPSPGVSGAAASARPAARAMPAGRPGSSPSSGAVGGAA